MAGRVKAGSGPRTSSGPRTKALVASSMQYAGNVSPRIYGGDKGWQQECYRFYGIIGEARQAARYFGNAMGKCEAFMETPTTAADGASKNWVASYDSAEAMVLDDMFSGRNNQGQAFTDVGIHLTIGGECFILGKFHGGDQGVTYFDSTVGDGTMTWEVASPLEMQTYGNGWQQTVPGEELPYIFQAEDIVIRVWRSDPYRRNQADSPFKSLLPVLKEIEQFTEHINSQIVSRLVGAGILFVPAGMDFPEEEEQDGKATETANGPSRFMKILGNVASKALRDRGSAAARVPIIIQAPDDLIDKARLMTFWSDLDEKAAEMRTGALHRFAAGMDLPNEKVEGMASNNGTGGGTSNGVSHWGAWEIDEDVITGHIEPAMDLLVAAILIDWVRTQVPNTVMRVAYSTARLRLRPDRSKEALELYNLGLLKPEALFREVGFDTGDMADDADRKAMILWKLSTGSATPDQVAAAAATYGITLPLASTNGSQGQAPAPALPQAPSLEDHPTKPRDPSEVNAALHAACNALVLQALQRVGNHLMAVKTGKVVPPEGVPTHSVHTFAVTELDADRLLAKAFPMAADILDGIADPADVMPCLRRYTATLVASKTEHSRAEMIRWLEQSGAVA